MRRGARAASRWIFAPALADLAVATALVLDDDADARVELGAGARRRRGWCEGGCGAEGQADQSRLHLGLTELLLARRLVVFEAIGCATAAMDYTTSTARICV